ncbi:hypothetical protein IW256_007100 [Actinomadura viridis]|uniref:DUF1449 family protein n=1 Tax=Actinomadura viridis TaxID=58110 RepID=A0A931GMS7_9ACTN|nr:hypothetical protein [Actinomadura viridis]
MLVVGGYWGLVLAGGLGAGAFDGDADTGAGVADEGGGYGGLLAAAGLGGVPAPVVLSLLVAIAWFGSLTGSVLIDAFPGPVGRTVLGTAVLFGALGAAWTCTRMLVPPLRRVFRDAPAPSRRDFVGRVCVIRTGRVGTGFGQAEVTSEDGSAALVQVRVPGSDLAAGGLAFGDTALIFDYDPADEVFLVMPYDAPPDPGAS